MRGSSFQLVSLGTNHRCIFVICQIAHACSVSRHDDITVFSGRHDFKRSGCCHSPGGWSLLTSAVSKPSSAMSRRRHPPELKDISCHLPVAHCRTTHQHCYGKLLGSDQRIVQITLVSHRW